MADEIRVDRNLYLNADKDALVEEGDPDAAYVWAREGSTRSATEADELGYKPSTKAARQPANKAQSAPSEDKSLADMTKDELYELATEQDIDGRSTMSKAELIEALS